MGFFEKTNEFNNIEKSQSINVNKIEKEIEVEEIPYIQNKRFSPSVINIPKMEVVIVEEVIAPIDESKKVKQEVSGKTKEEVLQLLKNYDKKQWFALSANETKKMLDIIGIDYSHVSQERWELIKFLKLIVKE